MLLHGELLGVIGSLHPRSLPGLPLWDRGASPWPHVMLVDTELSGLPGLSPSAPAHTRWNSRAAAAGPGLLGSRERGRRALSSLSHLRHAWAKCSPCQKFGIARLCLAPWAGHCWTPAVDSVLNSESELGVSAGASSLDVPKGPQSLRPMQSWHIRDVFPAPIH